MESFPIAPAAARALWTLPLVFFLILIPLLAVGWSVMGSRTARFTVSPAGLQIQGDWYGRTIPLEQLQGQSARRIDFAREPGLTPQRRTWGTGLPGYQSGWFRLRNGESALLYLTDRGRAVYVPTTAGYALLLSPRDPDAFLSALRTLR
jgi:hypothetical protein